MLLTHPIIPVVTLHSVDDVHPTLSALAEGGIMCAEIVFRTDCAAEALALAIKSFPDMTVGAGTIINRTQCEQALAAGAQFIVSPGFSHDVAEICAQNGVFYLPGAVTPTEIIAALAHGINIVKFFPADVYGGVRTIKALSSAFPSVKFVPTGGVSADNLAEYLANPAVTAVGGSWMMSGDIAENNRQAIQIAQKVRENL